MTAKTWECICGKTCKLGEYCSPRCEYVAEMMQTPLGLQMDDIDRCLRFFGKQYDKKHRGK